ncbi:CpaF family protein [Candidatus Sumerlaeota bacterium]
MPIGSMEQQRLLFDQSLKNFLAPIADLLDDDGVSEIMINGPDMIFIEQRGKVTLVGNKFRDDNTLMAAIRNIAQFMKREFSNESPRLDARLPNGSRVHAIIPPICKQGICVAIRKFSKEKLTMEKLMDFGAITPRAVEFVNVCVKILKNMIVSGGTGSGKTSLLNVVSGLADHDERIVVIEDATEMQVQQEHVIQLEARPPDKNGKGAITIRDLLHSAMRLRPDRIIIGEVRGGEALDLLQAMTSGHSGSLATVHSNQPRDTLGRLETLSMYAGTELPLHAIRSQVASAIEIVIQTSRFRDGSRKISHITEILDLDDEGRYHYQDIFRFRSEGTDEDGRIKGKLVTVGNIPSFYNQMVINNLDLGKDFFEDGLQ